MMPHKCDNQLHDRFLTEVIWVITVLFAQINRLFSLVHDQSSPVMPLKKGHQELLYKVDKYHQGGGQCSDDHLPGLLQAKQFCPFAARSGRNWTWSPAASLILSFA
uniref:Uncharacterized protein n=1 Tax=Sphaerodactylus townsendi TaxID=933632 RepID=A0ACB8EZ11_9SAUR